MLTQHLLHYVQENAFIIIWYRKGTSKARVVFHAKRHNSIFGIRAQLALNEKAEITERFRFDVTRLCDDALTPSIVALRSRREDGRSARLA